MDQSQISRGICTSFALRALLFVLYTCVMLGCSETHTGSSADSPSEDLPTMVVLSPAFAHTLRSLGYGDQIVGRHRYDFLVQDSPAVGDNLSIDYETLAVLKPDVLIREAAATEPPRRLEAFAKDAGIAIVELPNLTLSDTRDAIQRLDALAQPGSEQTISSSAQSLLDRFDAALQTMSSDTIARSGAVLLMLDGGSVFGPGSFHHDLVLQLGFDVIPTSGAPFIRLSPEDIAALAPETILVFATDDTDPPLHEILGVTADLAIPANTNDRVYRIGHEAVMLPSVSVIETAELIRQVLDVPEMDR